MAKKKKTKKSTEEKMLKELKKLRKEVKELKMLFAVANEKDLCQCHCDDISYDDESDDPGAVIDYIKEVIDDYYGELK